MNTDLDVQSQTIRQEAFKKLRPVCVELSSVGLKFKAKQGPAKDVLHALEAQHRVLQELGQRNQLDPKLAEYAFFPLTHVLNESNRLSTRSLEITVQSVTILIDQGWRQHLKPEMGKQLLILMTLLVGSNLDKKPQAISDELRCAAFRCMSAMIKWLATSVTGKLVLNDQGTKNIVDQIVYLLVDNLSESAADEVQIAAAEALFELQTSIDNRVFLASLLPRTVSSLVKALRPSTQARRTHRVLSTNLKLLQEVLCGVLADKFVYANDPTEKSQAEALDETWLRATSSQVKNALIQVVKLRNHERLAVRQALVALCVSVIEDCKGSLADSISIMLETLVVLSGQSDDPTTKMTLKHLMMSQPELSEMLSSSFYDWTQSLPRIMQGNDDRPKENMLARVTNSFNLMEALSETNDGAITTLSSSLLQSITNVVTLGQDRKIHIHEASGGNLMSLTRPPTDESYSFQPILFHHQSEKGSSEQLQTLISSLQLHSSFGKLTRNIVDTVADSIADQKIAATWLALCLLRTDGQSAFDVNDMLNYDDDHQIRGTSRSYLVHDLYSFTKDSLLGSSSASDPQQQDWRMIAMSLEILVMQAQQLGRDYRDELYESLYPVLALFSSQNPILQNHAVTALNLLASACHYPSARDMLVDNVDYLVNSIAWKLNTFSLSPEAPRSLNMIIRLVGAKLIPYLDDLVLSIFTALDSYHGYPDWVEILFSVLKSMVDESVKEPLLAIAEQKTDGPPHKKKAYPVSTADDILDDLRARKKRKLKSGQTPSTVERESAPRRPWTKPLDDPSYRPPSPELTDKDFTVESLLKDDAEAPLPAPKEEEKDTTKPRSKSHELLLKIAEATVPHLSSPSPRVRQLLLQLLEQITPLLARHENSFLPLVNAIWPAVVQRLFAETSSTGVSSNRKSKSQDLIHITDDINEEVSSETEMTYNVCAAANVINELCENAGNFMSSRIEKILPQLLKLFKTTYAKVEPEKQEFKNKTNRSIPKSASSILPRSLSGPVDLTTIVTHQQQQQQQQSLIPSTDQPPSISNINTYQVISRSQQTNLLTSLLSLLTTILTHVTLSSDSADQVFTMLIPFALQDGRESGNLNKSNTDDGNDTEKWAERAREAMEIYNLDWLNETLV